MNVSEYLIVNVLSDTPPLTINCSSFSCQTDLSKQFTSSTAIYSTLLLAYYVDVIYIARWPIRVLRWLIQAFHSLGVHMTRGHFLNKIARVGGTRVLHRICPSSHNTFQPHQVQLQVLPPWTRM